LGLVARHRGDGLFVPNADSMYQDWSASVIELHRCDRQWCRAPRRIGLSAASLLPIGLLIRRQPRRIRGGLSASMDAACWTHDIGADLRCQSEGVHCSPRPSKGGDREFSMSCDIVVTPEGRRRVAGPRPHQRRLLTAAGNLHPQRGRREPQR